MEDEDGYVFEIKQDGISGLVAFVTIVGSVIYTGVSVITKAWEFMA